MSQVALIRNPDSTRNLKGASPSPVPAGVRVIAAEDLEALSRELEAAQHAGVDTVLIDGGDGTVREVLSRLPLFWGATLPRTAILPHGNTNLIAREVGSVALDRLDDLLKRLRDGPPLRETRRTLLCAERAGREPMRGFILGWGAYAEGTRIAREEIAARGTGQVAMAALRTLRRILIGRDRRALRRGVPATLAIDGEVRTAAPRLLGLATTLQGALVAGFNPFWGNGSGPVRWLDVRSPGHRLALAAPFMAYGRPRSWMTRSDYASGRANRIDLALDTPFVMDGELFDPPADGKLILSAGDEVVFLSL